MACSPQTASMKSRTIPSKSVEFQLVAGLVAVQSGGVSSGTTTFGYGYQGEYRTYSACSHKQISQKRSGNTKLRQGASVLTPRLESAVM